MSFPRLGLPFCTLFIPHDFPFYLLNGRNYELLHRLIQTPYLHLTRSTPLRKIFLTDHYLPFDYFQHPLEVPALAGSSTRMRS